MNEEERLFQLYRYERELWARGLAHVAGVDEAGRGPLAGPVVAAAVILPPDLRLTHLNDSKQVSRPRRELLAEQIRAGAVAWQVNVVSVEEIDRYNILQASVEAMCRAVLGLGVTPHHLLIDALRLDRLSVPQTPIIKGDTLSASIAAASILAKVTRDRIMDELHQLYPAYRFDRNRGYATAEHLEALARLGPCPFHRQSFAPVREWHLRGKQVCLF
mgnify:CR=1 FL=1